MNCPTHSLTHPENQLKTVSHKKTRSSFIETPKPSPPSPLPPSLLFPPLPFPPFPPSPSPYINRYKINKSIYIYIDILSILTKCQMMHHSNKELTNLLREFRKILPGKALKEQGNFLILDLHTFLFGRVRGNGC